MRQALRQEHATCCFFSESSFHQQPETDACARREPSNRAGLRIQAKKNAGHPRWPAKSPQRRRICGRGGTAFRCFMRTL